jgi:peptidylprolyl isomerase
MIQNPIFRTLGTFGMSVLLTASTWALSANTMNLSTYNTDTLPEGMYAKMSTNKGDIILKLHYDKTPLTVCNFVGLAEGKIQNKAKADGVPYYDGLKFHRVISNFMIQGGDPDGNGSGGPGYNFEDEIDASLKHTGPGILSMANAGPGTNGSQFFITHVATPWLDGLHTVFGAVISGQDVVNAIQQGDSIETLTIIRKGADAEKFEANAAAMDTYRGQMKEKAAKAAAEAAKEFDNWVMKTYPNAQKTASGLYYAVIQEGTGEQAVKGKTVAVHYSGKLTNGNEFDNSYRRGEPIEFKLGVGQVIPGWDEGIGLMKVGAKYTLIIPSELGYGKRGAGGVIPPNATLVFETELVSVK